MPGRTRPHRAGTLPVLRSKLYGLYATATTAARCPEVLDHMEARWTIRPRAYRRTVSNESPTETLRRFVDRVESLLELRIVRHRRLDASLTFHGERGKPIVFQHSQPDEDDLRSYLLAFRKFILKGEPTFVEYVLNVAEKHVVNDSIRQALRDVRREWKRAQAGSIGLRVNSENVPAALSIDLWINGHYFHDDTTKERQLREMARVPLSRWHFLNAVVDSSNVLFGVAYWIKVALREGSVT